MENLKIIIFSKKNSPCPVKEHFLENWVGKDLLGDIENIPYEINDDSLFDSIIVVNDNGDVLVELKDSESLQLDKLVEKIYKLDV